MSALTSLALASTCKREITLYELIDDYLSSLSKASYNTLKYYTNDFKHIISNKKLIDVNINDIQRFINYKRSMNLKETTIYRYYRMLQTIFNYAVSHKYINKNPCARR